MGPIVVFDKSSLQGLSVDEAVWLDTFYLGNITPLFFVETLADLEKEVNDGRSPEQIVGNLAEKTPIGGRPNVHHTTLSAGELLGATVEMHRVPVISGGDPVVSEGRRGIVFKEAPEIEALRRWEEGKFLEVERGFARAWRKALSDVDLDAIYQEGRAIIGRLGRPRDLSEAKALAVVLHDKPSSRYTREALRGLPLLEEQRREIAERWRAAGEPPIKRFAPFTAHVLIVDSLFTVALGADFISRERPTNKVDIAYLYYLPFCMVFTSTDNLHTRTAPLFLSDDQVFVRGAELKADLARLDERYSALPDDVKERGVMSFAHYPPTDGDFLVSRLWDKLMRPDWREHATNPRIAVSKEDERDLVAQISRMADAPRATCEFSSQEADALLVQRMVPVRRGKWRLVPPEVEKGTSR